MFLQDVAQLVECLISIHAVLSLVPEHKLRHSGTCCNPRTREVEVGGSVVQGCPQLYTYFEVSLEYPRTLSEKQNKTKHPNTKLTLVLGLIKPYL